MILLVSFVNGKAQTEFITSSIPKDSVMSMFSKNASINITKILGVGDSNIEAFRFDSVNLCSMTGYCYVYFYRNKVSSIYWGYEVDVYDTSKLELCVRSVCPDCSLKGRDEYYTIYTSRRKSVLIDGEIKKSTVCNFSYGSGFIRYIVDMKLP